jgi:hypothetical protein
MPDGEFLSLFPGHIRQYYGAVILDRAGTDRRMGTSRVQVPRADARYPKFVGGREALALRVSRPSGLRATTCYIFNRSEVVILFVCVISVYFE